MEKSFRYSFLFSLCLHSFLFYLTSRTTFRKIISESLPVELVRISLPTFSPAEMKKVVKEEKKSEEITLPKKEKKVVKKKKEELKKSEPERPKEIPEEKKSFAEEKKVVSSPATSLVKGSGVSLESARFAYTYYLNLIREKVGKNWSWPVIETRRKATIYFRILHDGLISEIRTKESSKDEAFDLAALRAIEISAPFPPLPAGFPEEYLGVYFEFSLQ